jgi:heterodisulfide reductase subunit C
MERIKPDMVKKISNDITEELVKDEALRAIRACYQCGTCCGGCPSGRRTALRTRKVIRKALLGLDEVLKDEDIWLCSTCYTCAERCPRGVPTTDIIIKLRNLASQKGYIMQPHKNLTYLLIQTGHGVPLGGTDNNWTKLRAAYGLEPIPPTTHSHPEAVDEIQTLVKDLKFDKLVGYPPPPPPEAKPAPDVKSTPEAKPAPIAKPAPESKATAKPAGKTSTKASNKKKI